MNAPRKRRAGKSTRPVRGKNPSSSQPGPADNTKLLRTLGEVFSGMNSVQKLLMVCTNACLASKADHNEEIGSVLERHGVDALFVQLRRLSTVIEGFGGETYLTGDDDGDNA